MKTKLRVIYNDNLNLPRYDVEIKKGIFSSWERTKSFFIGPQYERTDDSAKQEAIRYMNDFYIKDKVIAKRSI